MCPDNEELLPAFSDPEMVTRYAEGPPRFVPGFEALHRMAAILLAEQTPSDAHLLVLGAGGGLELKAFAETHPDWTFDGVDPAPEMLKLAARTLGPLASRARLHEGYIDDAPEGPFDAAVCLLTMHFLETEERRRTVSEVRRRLKPGAPFVVAHLSFPQGPVEQALWMTRYIEFAKTSGVDPEQAEGARDAVEQHLHVLTPEQDEAVLRDAGFSKVSLFYTAFTWRGWVASA